MYICGFLADQFGLTETEKNQLHRAAQIYKFDLVTGMVGEFPELQGVMGDKYAVLRTQLSVKQSVNTTCQLVLTVTYQSRRSVLS